MQRAAFQPPTITQIQTQATRVLPGHGTGVEEQATPDENSPLRLVFSVLANVIGGILLLSGLFILPHIVAGLF